MPAVLKVRAGVAQHAEVGLADQRLGVEGLRHQLASVRLGELAERLVDDIDQPVPGPRLAAADIVEDPRNLVAFRGGVLLVHRQGPHCRASKSVQIRCRVFRPLIRNSAIACDTPARKVGAGCLTIPVQCEIPC